MKIVFRRVASSSANIGNIPFKKDTNTCVDLKMVHWHTLPLIHGLILFNKFILIQFAKHTIQSS